MLKGLVGFILGAALMLGTVAYTVGVQSPFKPFLGFPSHKAKRIEVFNAEIAKIKAAKGLCNSIVDDIFVETNGKKSIWYVKCDTGMVVSFWLDEKDQVVSIQPEG